MWSSSTNLRHEDLNGIGDPNSVMNLQETIKHQQQIIDNLNMEKQQYNIEIQELRNGFNLQMSKIRSKLQKNLNNKDVIDLLDYLQDELTQKNQRLNEVEHTIQSYQSNIHQFKEYIVKVNNKNSIYQKQLVTCNEEIQKLAQELQTVKNNSNSLQNTNDLLKKELVQTKQRLDEVDKEAKELRQQNTKHQELNSTIRAEKIQSETKNKAVEEEITRLQIFTKQLQEQINEKDKKHALALIELEKQKKINESQAFELKNTKVNVGESQEEIKRQLEAFKVLQTQNAQLTADLAQLQQQYQHEQNDKLTYIDKLRMRDQDFIKLQSEKDLETAANKEQVNKLKDRIYALNNEFSELEDKYGQVFKEKNNSQRLYEQIDQQFKELQEKWNQAIHTDHEAKLKIQEVQQQVDDLKLQNAKLLAFNQQYQQELEALNNQLLQLKQEKSKNLETIDNQSVQITQLTRKTQNVEQQCNELTEQFNNLKNEHTSLKQNLLDSNKQGQQYKDMLDALQNNYESLQNKGQLQQQEIQNKDLQIQQTLKQKDDLFNQLEELKQQHTKLTYALKQKTNEYQDLIQQNIDVQQQLKQLKAKNDQTEVDNQELQEQLNRANLEKTKISKQIQELNEQINHFELQQKENQKQNKDLIFQIELLTQNKEDLLQQQQLIAKQLSDFQANSSAEIQELNKQIDQLNSKIQSQEQDKQKLSSQLNEQVIQNNNDKLSIDQLTMQISEQLNQIEKLNSQNKHLLNFNSKVKNIADNTDKFMAKLQNEYNRIINKQEQHDHDTEKVMNYLSQIIEYLSQLQNTYNQFQDDSKVLTQKQYNMYKELSQKFQDFVSEKYTILTELQDTKNNLNNTKQQLEETKQAFEQTKQLLEDTSKSLNEEKKVKKAQQQALDEANQNADNFKRSLEETKENLKQTIATLDETKQQLEEKIVKLQKIDVLNEQISNIKRQNKQVASEMKNILKQNLGNNKCIAMIRRTLKNLDLNTCEGDVSNEEANLQLEELQNDNSSGLEMSSSTSTSQNPLKHSIASPQEVQSYLTRYSVITAQYQAIVKFLFGILPKDQQPLDAFQSHHQNEEISKASEISLKKVTEEPGSMSDTGLKGVTVHQENELSLSNSQQSKSYMQREQQNNQLLSQRLQAFQKQISQNENVNKLLQDYCTNFVTKLKQELQQLSASLLSIKNNIDEMAQNVNQSLKESNIIDYPETIQNQIQQTIHDIEMFDNIISAFEKMNDTSEYEDPIENNAFNIINLQNSGDAQVLLDVSIDRTQQMESDVDLTYEQFQLLIKLQVSGFKQINSTLQSIMQGLVV